MLTTGFDSNLFHNFCYIWKYPSHSFSPPGMVCLIKYLSATIPHFPFLLSAAFIFFTQVPKEIPCLPDPSSDLESQSHDLNSPYIRSQMSPWHLQMCREIFGVEIQYQECIFFVQVPTDTVYGSKWGCKVSMHVRTCSEDQGRPVFGGRKRVRGLFLIYLPALLSIIDTNTV